LRSVASGQLRRQILRDAVECAAGDGFYLKACSSKW
jgi:hypothetical protein